MRFKIFQIDPSISFMLTIIGKKVIMRPSCIIYNIYREWWSHAHHMALLIYNFCEIFSIYKIKMKESI